MSVLVSTQYKILDGWELMMDLNSGLKYYISPVLEEYNNRIKRNISPGPLLYYLFLLIDGNQSLCASLQILK